MKTSQTESLFWNYKVMTSQTESLFWTYNVKTSRTESLFWSYKVRTSRTESLFWNYKVRTSQTESLFGCVWGVFGCVSGCVGVFALIKCLGCIEPKNLSFTCALRLGQPPFSFITSHIFFARFFVPLGKAQGFCEFMFKIYVFHRRNRSAHHCFELHV